MYWVRFDGLLENLKHTNFEPYIKDTIADQFVKVNQPFSRQVNDQIFFDDDGNETLHYDAELDDDKPLPAWLSFDPERQMFTGTPVNPGTYKITVTATDTARATATCIFTLIVSDNK